VDIIFPPQSECSGLAMAAGAGPALITPTPSTKSQQQTHLQSKRSRGRETSSVGSAGIERRTSGSSSNRVRRAPQAVTTEGAWCCAARPLTSPSPLLVAQTVNPENKTQQQPQTRPQALLTKRNPTRKIFKPHKTIITTTRPTAPSAKPRSRGRIRGTYSRRARSPRLSSKVSSRTKPSHLTPTPTGASRHSEFVYHQAGFHP